MVFKLVVFLVSLPLNFFLGNLHFVLTNFDNLVFLGNRYSNFDEIK